MCFSYSRFWHRKALQPFHSANQVVYCILARIATAITQIHFCYYNYCKKYAVLHIIPNKCILSGAKTVHFTLQARKYRNMIAHLVRPLDTQANMNLAHYEKTLPTPALKHVLEVRFYAWEANNSGLLARQTSSIWAGYKCSWTVNYTQNWLRHSGL